MSGYMKRSVQAVKQLLGGAFVEKDKRTVENTKTPEAGRAFLLEALVTGGASGTIERQEERGQQQLVNSDVLPADIHGREALERAGVVFGGPVQNDPLFVYATLPAGWKKASTGHSMWSDLLDEQGRKRASIGYKAAFYDRWASMSATHRFTFSLDYSDEAQARKDKECVGIVKDGERVIYRAVFQVKDGDPEYGPASAYEQAQAAARGWLTARYPNWEDASAYWDLPPVETLEDAGALN